MSGENPLRSEYRARVQGRRRPPASSGRAQLALAGLTICALAVAVHWNGYPVEVLYWVLGFSVASIGLYGKDKYAAVNNRWRISEGMLHLLAVVGGWPGAAVAQRLFKHKISKRSFRRVFWITVLLNSVVIGWTFSDSGRETLNQRIAETRGLTASLIESLP